MRNTLGLVFSIIATSALAQAERTIPVQQPIEAPCEAWVKQADGSWELAPNVTLLLPGDNRMKGYRLRGGPDVAALDRKCVK